MSDLIGICGQVRGLEPRLLDKNQIDRMVGAASADEAFNVLSELQYADYLDQDTSLADFEDIISQGLFETKTLLQSGSTGYAGMDFLWLKFDLTNLKRALKQKLIEGKTALEGFGVDKSFSRLGSLTEMDLNRIVFEKKAAGSIPFQVLEAVFQADTLYAKNDRFLEVEFALDKAYFDHLNAVVGDTGDGFLADFFEFLVDMTQVRNLARSVLVMKQPVPEIGHIDYGHFGFEKVARVEQYDEVVKLVKPTVFANAFDEVDDSDDDATKMLKIEHGLDTLYRSFLNDKATGSLDSVSVLINYFEQRLDNARLLKLIMFSKMNGLSPEQIYDIID